MNRTPVKIAIIGVGAIGRKHARLLHGLTTGQLAAISDTNPEGAQLADELGAHFFTDYKEMLTAVRPDGVIIATPTATHEEVALTCIEFGCHMLVEKPIASNTAAAERMVDAAERAGVKMLVGHHRRYNPLIEKAREILHSGRLGKLVGVNVLWMLKKPEDYYDAVWRRQPGGGPFLTNLIHEIDNLRFICGEITRVYAEASSVRGYPVEDSGSITIRFLSGAIGTILISDCTPSRYSYEQSSGENPYYFRTDGDCYIFFGTEGSLAFPSLEITSFADRNLAGWQHPLTRETIKATEQDPLLLQLQHFCDVIQNGTEPRITGEDGLRTLAVVRGIMQSAEQAIPVEFS